MEKKTKSWDKGLVDNEGETQKNERGGRGRVVKEENTLVRRCRSIVRHKIVGARRVAWHIQFFSLNHITDKKTKIRMLMIAPIYYYIQQVSIQEFILLSVQSSFWSVKRQSLSRVWLFATLWTVAGQVPLSMEFSRQEYWSRQPFPSPGDLPDSGIKMGSPSLKTDSLPSEPPGVQSICCEGW